MEVALATDDMSKLVEGDNATVAMYSQCLRLLYLYKKNNNISDTCPLFS